MTARSASSMHNSSIVKSPFSAIRSRNYEPWSPSVPDW